VLGEVRVRRDGRIVGSVDDVRVLELVHGCSRISGAVDLVVLLLLVLLRLMGKLLLLLLLLMMIVVASTRKLVRVHLLLLV
jgi:hypothetical protein